MAIKNSIYAFIGIIIAVYFLLQGYTGSSTSFLAVSGNKVIDGSGNPALLRGFNIAFKDFFNGTLGEADIKWIADTGANSIRLVLDYRQLESAPFQYNADSFLLLDAILRWCERHHIYVILDMHLAPGIQNPHDFVLHREDSYEFWTKKEYQKRFYALWAEIARRYAERKIIAGYDLLNEGTPPDIEDYRRVMNNAAKAIRMQDKNHILIVQEAMLSGGGEKELALIDDKNTVYSIHFFYPPQFTFYTTTRQRMLTQYPGEMAVEGDKIGEARTAGITGTTGWMKLNLEASPPEGAEILMVSIISGANSGTVWFDDIHLETDGTRIDLPCPLVSNNSFEIDYPGINWNTKGSGVAVTNSAAKTGHRSVMFSMNRDIAFVQSSPVEVRRGTYTLTAWVKSMNATGDNYLSLSWHRRKVAASVDRRMLLEKLRYAMEFRNQNNVPVFVGEFTVHANPSMDSVVNYLKDILEIMKSEGLHWSYWTYYSEYPGIGIYTGNSPFLARPEEMNILKEYMKGAGASSFRNSSMIK